VDFTLSESQIALRDLADRIIGDHADVERIKGIERAVPDGGDGIDRDLWAALAAAGVLSAVGEPGGGADVVDAALVCEAQGRHLTPLPLWPALAALVTLRDVTDPAWTAARDAVVAGDDLVTVALAEPGQTAPGQGSVRADAEGRLTGAKVVVPAAPLARWVLVPVAFPAPALHLVDTASRGVNVEQVVTTDRGLSGHLRLEDGPSVRVGDAAAVDRLAAVATALVCALHTGVCAEAVRQTADYLGSREQFGRPLSHFQGPVLRIADAHIDTEAMRVTALQAAWRLETGRPAADAVATAKWWAAEAGHRVVHATQHLHGGMGADTDYPIHRYFLWGKQLCDTLGGSGAQAAELGRLLAAGVGR
jgi:3-oxocholest-4-en-26-oyl-CoA dehydrogenase beta subunit